MLFQLHDLLNDDLKEITEDGEKADHDFDRVRHPQTCDYSDDSDKVLEIDVSKIIGSATGGVCTLTKQLVYKKK